MHSTDIHHIILSVLAGDATPGEHEELAAWLAQSADNQKEYDEMIRIHQITQKTIKPHTYNIDNAWQKVAAQTISKQQRQWITPLLRYAAILVSILTIGTYFYMDSAVERKPIDITKIDQPTLVLADGEEVVLDEKSFSIQQSNTTIEKTNENKITYQATADTKIKNSTNQLIIPRGKDYQLELSDGTKIWLNSESELTYPSHFDEDQRIVTLKGEAFFDVAKDANHPFIVEVDGVNVEVLGTSFNITAYDTDASIATTLVTGSVKLVPEEGSTEIIKPNEQYSYNKISKVSTTRTVDTELYTSWIDNYYTFNDATINEIITKIARWHNIEYQFENEQIKETRFSLKIQKETSLANIIDVINFTNELYLEIVNNSIHIKKIK
jgi:ferric-dicitrate binding protein FerR (iron transport regulator)